MSDEIKPWEPYIPEYVSLYYVGYNDSLDNNSKLLRKCITDDLKAAILRNKKVTLDISFYTKTSLNVSLNIEDISFRCSYVPAGCENLKFHTTPGHNMWTSGNYEANYFKILKRQKWNEFKKYGMALIDSLRLDTKETITLRFLIDEDIMEKMGIVEGTQTGFFHHFKND